eukprot:Rhum_TRINITY_DN11292_c0_g1::Rhum_TRINITY_DN11292_c0_g1_i1::g.43725::m.43725
MRGRSNSSSRSVVVDVRSRCGVPRGGKGRRRGCSVHRRHRGVRSGRSGRCRRRCGVCRSSGVGCDGAGAGTGAAVRREHVVPVDGGVRVQGQLGSVRKSGGGGDDGGSGGGGGGSGSGVVARRTVGAAGLHARVPSAEASLTVLQGGTLVAQSPLLRDDEHLLLLCLYEDAGGGVRLVQQTRDDVELLRHEPLRLRVLLRRPVRPRLQLLHLAHLRVAALVRELQGVRDVALGRAGLAQRVLDAQDVGVDAVHVVRRRLHVGVSLGERLAVADFFVLLRLQLREHLRALLLLLAERAARLLQLVLELPDVLDGVRDRLLLVGDLDVDALDLALPQPHRLLELLLARERVLPVALRVLEVVAGREQVLADELLRVRHLALPRLHALELLREARDGGALPLDGGYAVVVLLALVVGVPAELDQQFLLAHQILTLHLLDAEELHADCEGLEQFRVVLAEAAPLCVRHKAVFVVISPPQQNVSQPLVKRQPDLRARLQQVARCDPPRLRHVDEVKREARLVRHGTRAAAVEGSSCPHVRPARPAALADQREVAAHRLRRLAVVPRHGDGRLQLPAVGGERVLRPGTVGALRNKHKDLASVRELPSASQLCPPRRRRVVHLQTLDGDGLGRLPAEDSLDLRRQLLQRGQRREGVLKVAGTPLHVPCRHHFEHHCRCPPPKGRPPGGEGRSNEVQIL